jgi:hypothetical protein
MPKDPRTNTGVSQLLTQAISAFRAGNLFEAHRLCATVIDKDKKISSRCIFPA